MTLYRSTTALALGLLLAACSSSEAPPPSGARAAPPPSATGGASGSTSGGADDSGIPLSGPIEVPESAGWSNPNVTPEQHRADLESCYGYAWGQIRHDERIESDRGALRDDDLGIGYRELNRSMNQFDLRNRRSSLFSDCMKSRGYSTE
jgi:hypothetical protein